MQNQTIFPVTVFICQVNKTIPTAYESCSPHAYKYIGSLKYPSLA